MTKLNFQKVLKIRKDNKKKLINISCLYADSKGNEKKHTLIFFGTKLPINYESKIPKSSYGVM